tara:strand:+ start:382 stop:1326 length:945 start_codon:yes stop_codon:yes gene_type:complete
MKTCLIFGINSFTGQYVKRTFEQKDITVIGTTYSSNKLKKIDDEQTHQINILNADDVATVIKKVRPDYVINLAGISHVMNHDISQFYNVHILGTRNILDALVKYAPQVQKVVLASSAQVYGTASYPNEQTLCIPTNDYSVSKLSMEHMASLWSNQLPIVITRPFNCIGIGQADSFLVSKIIQHFTARKVGIELGDTLIERDFVDIRLAALDYYTITMKGRASSTYNIGSGQKHAIIDIIDTLSKISGHHIAVSSNPEFFRLSEAKSIRCNTEKLLSLYEKRPTYSLEKTLKWIYSESTAKTSSTQKTAMHKNHP